jgi:hypothetical protein
MSAPTDPDLLSAQLLGESAPEHGLAGRTLILFIHCVGVVSWLGLVFLEPGSAGERLVLAGLGLAIPAGCAYLAESLRRFECWAWFFMMLWVVPVALGLLGVLAAGGQGEAASVSAGLVSAAGCIHYLWSRRLEFWADAHTRTSARPARRWVTPEWRAARLARIGNGAAHGAPSV